MKVYIPLPIDNAEETLKTVCEQALAEKYGESIPDQIWARYESELGHIVSNGFSPYYILASMRERTPASRVSASGLYFLSQAILGHCQRPQYLDLDK